jgi:branched-chain amino acid transport system substrate-binding protein
MGEPKQAVAAFNKLIDLNKVPIVLGDVMSATTLAAAPIANRAKVPIIGIGSSAPAVTQAGPYVYRVWPSDLYEGRVAATWATQSGHKKACLIFLHNDYGVGIKNAFKERFIALGGKIAAEQSYTSDAYGFRNVVAKLKGIDCDIIYVVGYYENTALMIKNLREAGITALLLGTSSAMSPKISEIAGNSAEGFLVAVVNDIDEDNLSPTQKEFFTSYEKRYGQKPDWAAVKGADAILVAINALQSGAKSGKEVKSTLDKIHTFAAISTEVSFDANGDVVNKPIIIKLLHNGSFVFHATPKITP